MSECRSISPRCCEILQKHASRCWLRYQFIQSFVECDKADESRPSRPLLYMLIVCRHIAHQIPVARALRSQERASLSSLMSKLSSSHEYHYSSSHILLNISPHLIRQYRHIGVCQHNSDSASRFCSLPSRRFRRPSPRPVFNLWLGR